MTVIETYSPVESNSSMEENARVFEKPAAATPVSKSLRTVLVCVADTPNASYAFNWTMDNFLQGEDMDSVKVWKFKYRSF
jgi:hypothetical protein